ncbi:MAG: carboxypeptidase regulatory-like domain-containing protein [bacterium]
MTRIYIRPCVSLLLVFFSLLLLSGCSGGGGGGSSPSNPAPVVTSSPFPTASPSGKAAIEGHVYVSEAKKAPVPLAEATVRVEGLDQTATTDSDGYFRIDGVPSGQHFIHIVKSGYALIEKICSTASNQVISLDIQPGGPPTTQPSLVPAIAYFEPEPPDEGGPIKIYGVNFGNNPQVKFNNLSVSPQDYWSRQDNEIICLVPSGASSGNVSVIAGANTALKPITVTPRKELVISSHYVSATDSDISVTIRLNKSLNDLNGFAFFLKFNPAKITVNTSYGKNGVEKASSLAGGLLAAQSRSSASQDTAFLDVGLTLKGETLSGSRDLAVIHFRPGSSLKPGTLCKIEIDTSRKQPQACLKTGSSASFRNLTWTAGHLMVRR